MKFFPTISIDINTLFGFFILFSRNQACLSADTATYGIGSLTNYWNVRPSTHMENGQKICLPLIATIGLH